MRYVPVLALAIVAACGTTAGDMAFPAVQQVIDQVAGKHADLVRLTLHGIPQGKSDAWVLGSTAADKLGKKSDPEDLEAMNTGETVVLEEGNALDVTVPILMSDGKATAVAGVTLEAPEGAVRDQLISRAKSIASEIAAAVQGAGKPLW